MAGNDPSPTGHIILMILATLLIAGLFLHIASIYTTYQDSWESTPGTITDKNIKTSGSDGDTSFYVQIDYIYTVDGKDYSNTQRVSDFFDSRSEAEEMLTTKFAVGSQIPIHYSPHMPSWAEYRTGEYRTEEYRTAGVGTLSFAIAMVAGSLFINALLGYSKDKFTSIMIWRDVKLGRYSGKSGNRELLRLIEEKDITTQAERRARIERFNPRYTDNNSKVSVMQSMLLFGSLLVIPFLVLLNTYIARFTIIFGLPFFVPLLLSPIWDVILLLIAGGIFGFLWNKHKLWNEHKELFKNQDEGGPEGIGICIDFFLFVVFLVVEILVIFLMGFLVFSFGGLVLFAYFGMIAPLGYVIYILLQPLAQLFLPDSIIYSQGLPLLLSQLLFAGGFGLLVYLESQAAFKLQSQGVGLDHTEQVLQPKVTEITAMTSSDQRIAYAYRKGVFIQHIEDKNPVELDHAGTLTSLEIAGSHLIGCSDQGIVHTWNLKTYELTTTTADLEGITTSTIYGKQLILADQVGKLVIVDLDADEIIAETELDTETIVDVKILDKTVLLLDFEGKLIEIEPLDGTIVQQEALGKGNAIVTAIHGDEHLLYLAQRSEDIISYQLEPVIKERFRLSTASSVRSMIVIDSYLIAGLADGQLQLFDLANQNQTSFVKVHMYSVDYLSYNIPYLISASSDGTVKVFDLYGTLLPAITEIDKDSHRIVPQQWLSQEQAKDLIYCYICMTYSNEMEEIVHCPSCRAAFHKDEIGQWFRTKKICPICRNEVNG